MCTRCHNADAHRRDEPAYLRDLQRSISGYVFVVLVALGIYNPLGEGLRRERLGSRKLRSAR